MVIRKLKSATENDVLESVPNSTKSCQPSLINQSLIFSVVRRVVWYPLVPLIVQFFNSLLETYAYTHKVDIKLNLWISNVNPYESQYPHLSHNKAIGNEFSMTINCKKSDIIKKNIISDDIADIINYMVLIKLFSVPRFSSRIISLKLLSPTNSSENNQNNDSKRDSKQDIILNNQNNPTNIINTNSVHDPFNSTINEVHDSTYTANVDERQIDIMPVNDESTKSVSDELTKIFSPDIHLSEEIESCKLMLRKI
ncbi:14655_t:CDS:2 [Cetraspora pellucida]|uniref:14655_t:CDS:1 n=1 Tax=Cetraspora pellucida TaxID=1433469 RepID=A0A9N9BDL1_9GLOM|nr:14655_t:CDS:2 [Cetraspora pellucida]